MSANSFIFKQFAVDQTDCAMKVGTDGVLLGAWCGLRPSVDKALLDIGTGTGLIALQLAQRTAEWGARIEAVEIDARSAARAQANFTASKWANRLTVNHLSFQSFAAERLTETHTGGGSPETPAERLTETHTGRDAKMSPETPTGQGHLAETTLGAPRKFDHIVSNPPFFVDSLRPPDPVRSAARHATKLSYEDLISLSVKLLDPKNGTISLIVPAGVETEKILRLAMAEGLQATRLTEVHSTPKSGPRRTLVELSWQNATPRYAPNTEKLTIQDADGEFSAEYRALTRDFYLNFL